MGKAKRAKVTDLLRYKIAYFAAQQMGLKCRNRYWRYLLLVLPQVCLCVAAYLFGPEHILAAVGTLLIGFGIVFLVVYFWILEERRRRDVMYGREKAQPDDADNPDLRQEALVTCLFLFVLTPLLLLTLNNVVVHTHFAREIALWGGHYIPLPHSRPVELAQWFVYTLIAAVNTLPVVDYLLPDVSKSTGISADQNTAWLLGPLLELLFAVFLTSIVVQQFGRVASRIQDAIDSLKTTSVLAGGLGPIMLKKLIAKVALPGGSEQSTDQDVYINAVRALGLIANKYSATRRQISDAVGPDLILRFERIPVKTKQMHDLELMTAFVTAFCQMDFTSGISVVKERILDVGEFYVNRRLLVDAIALDQNYTRAIDVLKELHQAIEATQPNGKLASRIRSHLNVLMDSEDLSATEPVPAAHSLAPTGSIAAE